MHEKEQAQKQAAQELAAKKESLRPTTYADLDSDSDFNDDMDEAEADAFRKLKERRLEEFEDIQKKREQKKDKQQGAGKRPKK